MKYTILYETTSTHERTVELDDDFFANKDNEWPDIPECDGSTNFSQVEECKPIYITNDKGEEVWQI